jgi:type IV pilus assembly protein PilA
MPDQSSRLLLIFFVVLVTSHSAARGNEQKERTHEETVQQQISKVLYLTGGAKAAIAEFFLENAKFPSDNAEAGLAEPFKITGRYTYSVTVIDGVLIVELGGISDAAISGRTIEFLPTNTDGTLTWVCRSKNIENRFLPPSCENS